jgi:ankyrin repeat protein
VQLKQLPLFKFIAAGLVLLVLVGGFINFGHGEQNERLSTELVAAVEAGDANAVASTLSAGASPDSRRTDESGSADLFGRSSPGQPVLSLAAGSGSVPIVRKLIDRGADVNVRSDDGMTPLMFAAFAGEDEVVEVLVSRGADTTLTDILGRSAQSLALEGKSAFGKRETAKRKYERVLSLLVTHAR